MTQELGLDEEFDLVDQIDIDITSEVEERKERAASLLRQRKTAYGRVFQDAGVTPDDCKVVLDDLARFCRKDRSTFDPNVQMAARLDGRREVILRIFEYLNLSVEELMKLKFKES